MKKIEPTPAEDRLLQQEVAQYIAVTQIMIGMRRSIESIEAWEKRTKGGDHHADQERKTAGPEAH